MSDYEYDYDFGFSAVDADELRSYVNPSQEDETPNALTQEDFDRLELKIDQLTQLISDSIGEVEERKIEVETEVKEGLVNVEKLILPLLYNLKKNPEKEYILWPNREQMIDEQIRKILSITRSSSSE